MSGGNGRVQRTRAKARDKRERRRPPLAGPPRIDHLGPANIRLRGPLNDLTLALTRAGFRPRGWGRFSRTQEAVIESTQPRVRPPWPIRWAWLGLEVARALPLLLAGFLAGLLVPGPAPWVRPVLAGALAVVVILLGLRGAARRRSSSRGTQ